MVQGGAVFGEWRDTPCGPRKCRRVGTLVPMRSEPDVVMNRPGGASNPAADALDLLRATGHRMTVARRAVIEALASHAGHPGAEELCVGVEARVPGVHRATVYRTLETLAKLGVVRRVRMGHGTAAYHLTAAAPGPEHLHAQCRACGAVVDLPGGLLDVLRTHVLDRHGFVLELRHMALSGTCVHCPTPQ